MDKRKITYLRPWWWAFFIGQKCVLETPLSLTECHELLAKENRRPNSPEMWFGLPKRYSQLMLVQVQPTSRHHADLFIQRDAGKGLVAEVVGELKRTKTGTRIAWRGRIALFPLVIITLHYIIWITLSIAMPFIAPTLLVHVLVFGMMVNEREQLTGVPYRALVTDVRKKKST